MGYHYTVDAAASHLTVTRTTDARPLDTTDGRVLMEKELDDLYSVFDEFTALCYGGGLVVDTFGFHFGRTDQRPVFYRGEMDDLGVDEEIAELVDICKQNGLVINGTVKQNGRERIRDYAWFHIVNNRLTVHRGAGLLLDNGSLVHMDDIPP